MQNIINVFIFVVAMISTVSGVAVPQGRDLNNSSACVTNVTTFWLDITGQTRNNFICTCRIDNCASHRYELHHCVRDCHTGCAGLELSHAQHADDDHNCLENNHSGCSICFGNSRALVFHSLHSTRDK
ncbi:hypothetical protein G7K_4861-t1 [Saitoella complicata NRRL Y-17804]|uniref:Uncharacterized protein n=1 Tax=Saitoella complicata (strain BCRC 22490 / CBS 7301 / JCM 7358 / NBRC 10748 / NRRL Y-17804) TaxID=698492 RepID=A0A0E9NMU1_SAICN|nr:hypothetical protein G7K_4861-t1 [Saitoella complicata NRRL Y-17804]